jgi:hypothetical protein
LPDPAETSGSHRDRWFDAFERGVNNLFPDFFGDVGWAHEVNRTSSTVSAGDRLGGASVTLALPERYLEQPAWLLAGTMLLHLRRTAEEAGFLQPRP